MKKFTIRVARVLFGVLLLAKLWSAPLGAQSTFGSFRGEAIDATGSAIPSATIKLHGLDDNSDRQTISAHHFRGFGVRQLGKFGFNLAAERHHGRAKLRRQFLKTMFFDHPVDVRGFIVSEVQHVEHGLAGEKFEAAEHLQFFGFEVEFAKRRFTFQRFAATGQNLQLLAHLDELVATGWPVAVGLSRKRFATTKA